MRDRTYDVDASQRGPLKIWTRGVPVEESAAAQRRNVASLPFVGPHVAVMPDVHGGIGATVGSEATKRQSRQLRLQSCA